MAERLEGGCMCGRVRFRAAPRAMHSHACHCEQCRRWSGGIYLAVDCGDTVEIAEGAPVRFYPSSDWAERGFCAECGSSLFWRLCDGSATYVALNAFDRAGDFTLESEIYIDAKPAGYALAGVSKQLTRAEVMALLAEKDD